MKLEVDQCLSAWVASIDPRFQSEVDDTTLAVTGSEYLGTNLSIVKVSCKGSVKSILARNPQDLFSFGISDVGLFRGMAGNREIFSNPQRLAFILLPGESIKLAPAAEFFSGYIFHIKSEYLLSESIKHGTQLPSLLTLHDAIPGHEQLVLACANQLLKFFALGDEVGSLRVLQPLEESIVSLLATLISVEPDVLVGGKQAQSQPSYVQIALSYMENNISENITLSDLCIACSVSGRTLQVAFQAVMSRTPLQVLQELRLNRLRDKIINGMDISSACEEVGLQHSGRISAKYKQLFGELPRNTRSRRTRS